MSRFAGGVLWEYLGHPEGETPERRRLLYAIVVLRVGLGLTLLLRGWQAIFAPTPTALAVRLGDVARWGLGPGASADLLLFLLGCTEVTAGLLLLFGAFTRVSAVTGSVLAILYVLLGTGGLGFLPIRAALLTTLGGYLIVVICGSPFLSADRALDKLEEEERDRAPAVLPRLATATPIAGRLGLAAGLLLLGLYWWRIGVGWAGLAAIPALLLVAGLLTRINAAVAGLAVLLASPSFRSTDDRVALTIGAVAVAAALIVTGAGRWCLDRCWDDGQEATLHPLPETDSSVRGH